LNIPIVFQEKEVVHLSKMNVADDHLIPRWRVECFTDGVIVRRAHIIFEVEPPVPEGMD